MSSTGERRNFLDLLDNDRASAEAKYVALRKRLVFFFRHYDVPDAEDAADETLTRALRKIGEGAVVTTELPNYCFGVARNIVKERKHERVGAELRPDVPVAPQPPATLTPVEQGVLIGQCLCSLTSGERELLMSYFVEDRADLANRLGISPNGLRIRVHRLMQNVRHRIQAAAERKRRNK
jgi:DNA-directed RNA polymerase specialized sigma24 family protein